MKIKAQYIPHRNAYRLFVNKEQTIAYDGIILEDY